MFGALSASLIGYQKFVADPARVGCSDTWTDPGDGKVIKLMVPECHDYLEKHDAAFCEIASFIGGWIALFYLLPAFKKTTDNVARFMLAGWVTLALFCAIYLPLRWAARNHVEGSWRPTPFLMPVAPPGWTRENYQDNIWRAHGWNESEIADWNKSYAEGAARVARMGNKMMAALIGFVVSAILIHFGS